MSNPPGHYHAQGDPPDTVRYWDGTQWVGDPIPAPPSAAPASGGDPADKFATLGIRIGAGLIDLVLSVIVAFVLVLAFFGESDDDGGFSGSADTGGSILISLVFWAIFLAILTTASATPGKLMLGLLVTKEDGQSRIEFQQAFMRSLPGLFGVIPGINILVGLVMLIGSIIGILNDAERRSFYDRIGKTRVVYKNKL